MIIDYDTALLAQRAGMNDAPDGYYMSRGWEETIDHEHFHYREGDLMTYNETLMVPEGYIVPAWTQERAAQWLRKECRLHVYAVYGCSGWMYAVQDMNKLEEVVTSGAYETHGEAMDSGIRCALGKVLGAEYERKAVNDGMSDYYVVLSYVDVPDPMGEDRYDWEDEELCVFSCKEAARRYIDANDIFTFYDEKNKRHREYTERYLNDYDCELYKGCLIKGYKFDDLPIEND